MVAKKWESLCSEAVVAQALATVSQAGANCLGRTMSGRMNRTIGNWHALARTAPPALIHGGKLDSSRPRPLGVSEQVERALVQLDHAIACSCEFYKFVVLSLEGGRD